MKRAKWKPCLRHLVKDKEGKKKTLLMWYCWPWIYTKHIGFLINCHVALDVTWGHPPGLSRPVDTTSSTLEPLRFAFMMRSSVTSDQKTSSWLWWKSRAMAFSRLLSSRVYSERCGRTWRMSMRLANSSTGSGPKEEGKADMVRNDVKLNGKEHSERPEMKWSGTAAKVEIVRTAGHFNNGEY